MLWLTLHHLIISPSSSAAAAHESFFFSFLLSFPFVSGIFFNFLHFISCVLRYFFPFFSVDCRIGCSCSHYNSLTALFVSFFFFLEHFQFSKVLLSGSHFFSSLFPVFYCLPRDGGFSLFRVLLPFYCRQTLSVSLNSESLCKTPGQSKDLIWVRSFLFLRRSIPLHASTTPSPHVLLLRYRFTTDFEGTPLLLSLTKQNILLLSAPFCVFHFLLFTVFLVNFLYFFFSFLLLCLSLLLIRPPRAPNLLLPSRGAAGQGWFHSFILLCFLSYHFHILVFPFFLLHFCFEYIFFDTYIFCVIYTW